MCKIIKCYIFTCLFNFSLMPILDNEDYSNLTPIASFFGMDNAEELTELG